MQAFINGTLFAVNGQLICLLLVNKHAVTGTFRSASDTRHFYGNRSCKIFSIQNSINFSSWKGAISFLRNVGTHEHSKLHEVSSPEYLGVYIHRETENYSLVKL
jgi:hypothetical protein